MTFPNDLTAMPNALTEPYKAAAWLADRHRTLVRLLDRLDAWTDEMDDSGRTLPDLAAVAQAVNDSHQHDRAWKAYEDQHHEPSEASFRRAIADEADAEFAYERAYDAWLAAGPQPTAAARTFGPMSGGEKRYLRLLAVLNPGTRVPFHLDDTDYVDRAYANDWLDLIAGTKR